jgi:MerR family mercuric resistance operon transcriptional regulator
MSGYSIGQLARTAGVPVSTVRFYERTGLLKPDARTGSNYRQYGQRALERLRFIRLAQATGFSLEGVRELLGLTQSAESPCDDLVALTRKRLADVRLRIKELRSVEKVLARSLQECCTGRAPDLCDEISRLKDPTGQAFPSNEMLVSLKPPKKRFSRP